MADFVAAAEAWLNGITGYDMSIHGYLAILATLIGVFGLYIALLLLVRKSRQSGHDEAVYSYRDPRQDP